MQNLDRRSFTLGAGALLAAAGLTACGKPQAADTTPADANLPETWDAQADVVVVGSGGAGFMAAAAAHEQGASSIILEKASRIGGDTAICGTITIGYWPDGTKNGSGMTDTREQWMADQLNSHPYSARGLAGEPSVGDLSKIERFADLTPEMFQWMQDVAGVQWYTLNYTQDGYTPQPSWDTVFPRDWSAANGLIPPLSALVATYSDVTVKTDAQVDEIIVDAAGNAVGVWYADPRGGRHAVKANKGVVLACGNFQSNRYMVSENLGALPASLPTTCSASNTGDGITMVQRIGGAVQDLDLGTHWSPNSLAGSVAFMYHQPCYGNPAVYGSYLPGILVNYQGQRYCDENLGYSLVGKNTAEQTAGIGWYIVDATGHVYLTPEQTGLTDVYAQADTIEELAKGMLVDPEALKATVDTYNASVAAGKDEAFGKALTGCPQLVTPPFYALPLKPVPYQTYGGITVDVDGHVLKTDGSVIPHLYAAGLACGSFAAQAGLFYLGGVSQALVFGRQAGKNAAAEEAIA